MLLKLTQLLLRRISVHLFRIDVATRYGLIIVGAFASYSLGANNIANVMGVFVPTAPFGDLDVFGLFTLNAAQQLFLVGGIAIAVGVFTYSKRVMLTVGNDLFRLSPIAALVVVLAQALVLFLFSSEGLEHWLSSHGLPTIPLVPVSSSQAVIGAVIGIGHREGWPKHPVRHPGPGLLGLGLDAGHLGGDQLRAAVLRPERVLAAGLLAGALRAAERGRRQAGRPAIYDDALVDLVAGSSTRLRSSPTPCRRPPLRPAARRRAGRR